MAIYIWLNKLKMMIKWNSYEEYWNSIQYVYDSTDMQGREETKFEDNTPLWKRD